MDQEKSLIISYLSKVSELILQMRYNNSLTSQAANPASASNIQQPDSTLNSNESSFGIYLPKQQYRMENQISQKFNSLNSMPITLEFFLQRKSDSTNWCVEQWQLNYEKDFGISTQIKQSRKATEKVLAVLARTISSLLVSTPLWKQYINIQDRKVKSAFILDYKLSFSKNQAIPDELILNSQTVQLSSGSISLKCASVNNFEKVFEMRSLCAKKAVDSNINSQISTANSSPQADSDNICNPILNMNYCQPNFRRKNEMRERFWSEKIDPNSDLLCTNQEKPSIQIDPVYSSTRERCLTIGGGANGKFSKNKNSHTNNNNTFRFSFSDNEVLSDEEKNMINKHLRKSSVVSVYSRKDDITIVSTPEEIASKMSDCPPSELNGLEIEMVLEENPIYSEQRDQIKDRNKSKQTHSRSHLYDNMSDEYNLNQQQNQQVIEDDFDFQLIEEERDRPIDLAIKRVSEMINAYKLESKLNKHTQSAFEMFSQMSRLVDSS